MLLQLDPDFNIQALKALVTLELVDAAIAEAEVEVAISQKGAVDKGVADRKEATQGANVEKAPDVVGMEAEVEVAPEGEKID